MKAVIELHSGHNKGRLLIDIDPQDHLDERVSPLDVMEALGLLPHFIDPTDPRPAREQFDANYGFGLYEFNGGRVESDGTYHSAFEEPTEEEPGDPPLKPLARTQLRDETIWFYPYAMVAIVQPDGASYVTRMD